MTHFFKSKLLIAAFFIVVIASPANAEPPLLQASGPIIYLADNLDEVESLGWCIDTIGRGFSERLHTRACSAGGEIETRDFSFTYDAESGRISSLAFKGKCITANVDGDELPIGLYDCEPENLAQKFIYAAGKMAFHPSGSENICISTAAASVDHGMLQSRALDLEVCDEVDSTLRQWLIKTN